MFLMIKSLIVKVTLQASFTSEIAPFTLIKHKNSSIRANTVRPYNIHCKNNWNVILGQNMYVAVWLIWLCNQIKWRSLTSRLKYSRNALHINVLPIARYFRQRYAPFFRHRRRSQGYPYKLILTFIYKKWSGRRMGAFCKLSSRP